MYNAATLKADASGYGLVRYLATGAARTNAGGRSMSGDARQLLAPLLEPKISRTFLHERYALLWTARPLTIYRFYGTDATATASILGAYWPPARPSLRVDRLGYESAHDTSHASMALKRSWNSMAGVVEASLAAGAHIDVGRVAPQSEMGRQLGGGAIQFCARAHLSASS